MDFWQNRNYEMMNNIMIKRGFVREFRDHGVVWVKIKAKINFLAGRPNRDTIIGDDDIINLKIQLGISRGNEFLEKL